MLKSIRNFFGLSALITVIDRILSVHNSNKFKTLVGYSVSITLIN